LAATTFDHNSNRYQDGVLGSAARILLPLTGPLVLLVVWLIVTKLQLVPPLLVPPPNEAFSRLADMLLSGDLLPDIFASVWRWAVGFATGCLVGVPIGLLLGTSPLLYRASFSLIDFFRSLPVTALFPLFLLLFGIGDSSKIAMAFAATVVVVILNSAYGVLQAQKTRIRAAKVFGATRWQVFRWVTFFEALPQTFVGMRTSLSLALIVVIVSDVHRYKKRPWPARLRCLYRESYRRPVCGFVGQRFRRISGESPVCARGKAHRLLDG
jgi:ABC-type nitrate/sulfonate/bicarbonate transport system permease component